MLERLARGTARRLRRTGHTFARWAQQLDQHAAAPPARDLERLLRNAELRDIARGRPGFVIGNGASLARQNLAPLAQQFTFVANAFWRHPLLADADSAGAAWQPAFYTLIDPLYFDGSPPMRAFFAELRRRVRQARFMVPLQHLETIERLDLLPLERVHPCLMRGDLALQERAGWDLARPVSGVINVALLGIITAIYAGCRPIYLLGLDHDWLATPGAACRHFYLLGLDHDWLATPGAACRHFYPGLTVQDHPEVAALENGTAHSYRFNVECVLTAFRSYEVLRTTAAELGIEILNATDGGFLDVFPRIRFDETVAGLLPGSRVSRTACTAPTPCCASP